MKKNEFSNEELRKTFSSQFKENNDEDQNSAYDECVKKIRKFKFYKVNLLSMLIKVDKTLFLLFLKILL